jgi:cation:H+ antiporter
LDYIIFIVSLAVLILGSEWFIGSAEKIGRAFGIPSFIIGVTIVAFGTSLPELATSIVSVLQDQAEVVIGNVVGSNITNILLVLGLTAYIGKGIKMTYDVMRTDMPILIGSAFLLYFTLLDGVFSMAEAILFLLGLAIFLISSLTGNEEEAEHGDKTTSMVWLLFALGGALVYFGAVYTIDSLTRIATSLDVSPGLISLGAIALGTSLPEVVVSISAVRKGKHAIAVGNVLGSNIFNTFAVVGISSFFGPLKMTEDLSFSLVFMVAVTIMFAVVCISKVISKWEGAILLLMYAYFMAELAGRIA